MSNIKDIQDIDEKPGQELFEHKDDSHVVHEVNKAHLAEAVAAEDQEHMGVLAALRLFPKAAFWSMVMSMVIVSPLCSPMALTAGYGSLRRGARVQPRALQSFETGRQAC